MDLFIHKNPLNINTARNDCPLTVLSVISISHLFVWSVGRHLFISFPVSQFNNWTCSFPKKLLKSPSFSFWKIIFSTKDLKSKIEEKDPEWSRVGYIVSFTYTQAQVIHTVCTVTVRNKHHSVGLNRAVRAMYVNEKIHVLVTVAS